MKNIDIVVATSPITGEIFAGKLNKKGDKWLSKVMVTNQAIVAVIEHLRQTKKEYTFHGEKLVLIPTGLLHQVGLAAKETNSKTVKMEDDI